MKWCHLAHQNNLIGTIQQGTVREQGILGDRTKCKGILVARDGDWNTVLNSQCSSNDPGQTELIYLFWGILKRKRCQMLLKQSISNHPQNRVRGSQTHTCNLSISDSVAGGWL